MALHAVLDGHGPHGDAVAKRAADVLIAAAAERVKKVPRADDNDALAEALRSAFVAAAESVDAGDDAAASGATASLALFAPPLLTVANVGDSTVVWARNGQEARVVSVNHHAGDRGERDRVERVGGVVRNGYLSDGDPLGKMISVTRALGDLDVRAIGVVSEPAVRQVVMEGKDDFVILATDGLWDAHGGVSPQQAVDRVRECFEEEGSLSEACAELMAMAKGKSAFPIDDAAVVVVRPGQP